MDSLTVLKTTCFVVFLSWLLVWALVPTKFYSNTWPKLNTKLNSTYFGEQGVDLLLFSFPLMFVSVLGCVYLHLRNKPNRLHDSNSLHVTSPSRFTFLKRPVVVMAPLGIVTATELTFAIMFIALLIWSLTNYLKNSFDDLYFNEGDKVWQAKFQSVSLILACIGNICWAFLFFPVSRGSSILPLIGLTSESSIKYHIWLGHLSNVLFSLHGLGYIIYWANTNRMAEMLTWSKNGISYVAGEIAILIATVMWVTSFPRFRRKMFEVFFYTHHLYILYIVFYVLHAGSVNFCTILPGIYLFAIDRYLRILQSRNRVRLLSARLLPCGAIELNFSKSSGLYYNPTSILFVNVPSISKLQWHPFTVTSNCNLEQDKLSILVESEGSWTQKLYKEISSSVERLEVSVEGPYGHCASHLLRHESLVMVSGGSGLSPFISIIREIIFQSNKPDFRVPNVHLICAFKNFADLSMLDILLPISGTRAELSKLQMQIEVYVTRANEQPKSDTQILLQSIWFKPNPLDSPISSTLGSNSWLWLGAIITSSFIMFLLLLGIVTRFYIYPIERSGTEVYHFSYKCLWDMFLVCLCVFTVSSAVFVWCKKQQNSIEGKQIQNLDEALSPTMSSISWLHYSDRELESLPHQSLAQATRVHFGARPNLKKILSDIEGSDVGVLVCGPRKMRHEVAKICSSGLADNLHFEAISFNW